MSIRVAVTPLMTTGCSMNPSCPQRGFPIDITRFICRTVHLNCTFHLYNSTDYGRIGENGTASGLMGAIQRGQFDMAPPVFTITYERWKAVTFSSPYLYPGTIFLTRSPNSFNNLRWSMLLAYQWPVWVIFLISLLSIISWTIFGDIILNRGNGRNWSTFADRIISRGWQLTTGRIGRNDSWSNSSRISAVIWCLIMLVLMKTFTSSIFSYRTLFKSRLPFTDLRSLIECLEKDQCGLISSTVSIAQIRYLLSSEDELSNRFKSAIKRNPIRIMPKRKLMRAILNEQNRFLVRIVEKGVFVASVIEMNRDCSDFYFVDSPILEYLAIPVTKNFSHLNKFDWMAAVMNQYGLHRPLAKKYFPALLTSYCTTTQKSPTWYEKGDMLHSMATPFHFLAAGSMLAFTSFAVEMICGHFRRTKRPIWIYIAA